MLSGLSPATQRVSISIITSQAYATRHGLSVTAYINAAIDEKMAKDDKK